MFILQLLQGFLFLGLGIYLIVMARKMGAKKPPSAKQ